MDGTIIYDEMCDKCKEWYEYQHSTPVVLDYLIVCKHRNEIKNDNELD